jgi:hypothetical protein
LFNNNEKGYPVANILKKYKERFVILMLRSFRMYDVFNELHAKAAMSAQSSGMSLNACIQKGLAAALLSELALLAFPLAFANTIIPARGCIPIADGLVCGFKSPLGDSYSENNNNMEPLAGFCCMNVQYSIDMEALTGYRINICCDKWSLPKAPLLRTENR